MARYTRLHPRPCPLPLCAAVPLTLVGGGGSSVLDVPNFLIVTLLVCQHPCMITIVPHFGRGAAPGIGFFYFLPLNYFKEYKTHLLILGGKMYRKV